MGHCDPLRLETAGKDQSSGALSNEHPVVSACAWLMLARPCLLPLHIEPLSGHCDDPLQRKPAGKHQSSGALSIDVKEHAVVAAVCMVDADASVPVAPAS